MPDLISSSARVFLDHLEAVFRRRASTFSRLDPEEPGAPPVAGIFFEDFPRPAYTTCATYGLSEAPHPDWTGGRAELLICVNSPAEAWGEAIMRLALTFRGECPFAYGTILRYGGPIAAGCDMSAFVAHLPALPGRPLTAAEITATTQENRILLVGMFPLYEGEVELIERIGLDAFGALEGYDPWDIHRADLSGEAPPEQRTTVVGGP